MDTATETIPLAGLTLIVLTYFADVRRRAIAQRREETNQRVNRVARKVQDLMTPAGGRHGPHLETLQEAGIRELSDAEIRAVMVLLAQRTSIALHVQEWRELESVDLSTIFKAAHGRINLSGGMPALRAAVTQLRNEGVDVTRKNGGTWRSLIKN